MRPGSVRTCFQIERCPHPLSPFASTAAALRRFYSVLIDSVGLRLSNGPPREVRMRSALKELRSASVTGS
jgi:hypothetical protein